MRSGKNPQQIIYNNLFTRIIFHIMYCIKRIPILKNYDIRTKILISFLFISTVPILIVGIVQYIYITTTYPQQLETNMLETLKQTDKNLTYELTAIARDSNPLILNKELISTLDFKGKLSEKELIDKITKVREILNYANNITNTPRDPEKVINIYVDWDVNTNAYFNDQSINPLSDMPPEYPTESNARTQKLYWRGVHMLPHTFYGTYISVINTILNFKLEPLGFIEINLSTKVIENMLDDIELSNNAIIVLLDNKNEIIKSTNDNFIDDPLFTKVREGVVSSKNSVAKSGILRMNQNSVLFKTNELSGFTLVAVIPKGDMTSFLNITGYSTFLVLFFCIMLSILLSLPISYNIYSPIIALSSAMKNVEEDNMKMIIMPDRNDEIGMLYSSFNNMILKIENLISTVYKSQIELKESEQKLLQASINPHFLYNTLDTINWLAVLNKQNDISVMARSLADIFRYSLSRGKDIIPISDEISLVKNYVNIQKIRLGDKVNIFYELQDEIYEYETLKLILQPIVENSILHGIKEINHQLQIKISAKLKDGNIVFEISDSGCGVDLTKIAEILSGADSDNKGYGLRNVNKRIKLYYGDGYGITYKKVETGTTAIVTIKANVKGAAMSAKTTDS